MPSDKLVDEVTICCVLRCKESVSRGNRCVYNLPVSVLLVTSF